MTPLTARYKFFPTKEAYENGKGGKIKTAHTSAIHTFLNKDFVEEHGLETVGDIINLLNSWGYSEGFYSKMSDFGFRFNMSAFEWYHRDSDYLSYKIVKLSPYGDSPLASCFSEVK